MRIIVGLGNPGKKYEATRHNMGFLILDELAKRLVPENKKWSESKKAQAQYQAFILNEKKIELIKPQTFMNKSGETAAYVVCKHKLNPATDVMVVHDDVDFAFGDIRVQSERSAAGHNGVASIIDLLGTNAFARVRVGIGRPQDSKIPLDEWVLQKWNKDEKKQLKDIVTKAADEVQKWL